MKISKKMNANIKIALISFTILFYELLLIRLIGTEIRIFAYLSNLVLLAIFIGSGLGMFVKQKIPLFSSMYLIALLTFIVASGAFSGITDFLSPLSESFFWYQSSINSLATIIMGLFFTIALFLLVMATFIPLGQYLGNLLDDSKNLVIAYSINVAFSLLGIWFFNLISFGNVSPYIGTIFALGVLITLIEKDVKWKLWIAPLLLTIVISLYNLFSTGDTRWSPYQKLDIYSVSNDEYTLRVNNVGYMGLLNLSRARKEELRHELELKGEKLSVEDDLNFTNQYDLPFILKKDAKNVLIIGAGGGNDVAGAIRAGIPHIDAVEIDPVIVEMGGQYHPEQPYSSPTVNTIVQDGRAFLRQTDNSYDIVIMALADSHTLNSSTSNVQLDNYLYTKESMQEVQRILKPEGILFLSFEAVRPWLGARIKGSVTNVFNREPYILNLHSEPQHFGWGGYLFLIDNDGKEIAANLKNNPSLNLYVQSRNIHFDNDKHMLTDDWPYLYLDQPRIPKIHALVSLFLISIFYYMFRKINSKGSLNLSAFFIGAGFLLYEFQNINRTAILYGNTWVTNVFVISAILMLILVANLIYNAKKIPLNVSFALLVLAFLLQMVLPISALNEFGPAIKFTIVPILINLPLLFSALIFINLFSDTKDRKGFFASNLIGSALGGLMGFASYLFGLQSLLFLSLGFYVLSFVSLKASSVWKSFRH